MIWIAASLTLLAMTAILFFSSAAHALDYEDYPVVKLRSLDKITARTMTFEAKVGSTVRFGEIFIKVQACRKPPPVEKSEASAFLQIWQSNDAQDSSKWIFSGWMFASSPALSAMDHPVYDVWVLDCLGRDPEPIPQPAATPDGVKTPVTDGAAPNAVPPAVEPDKQKPAAETPPSTPAPAATSAAPDKDAVTREDDPGAFEDEQEGQVPANLPQDAKPADAPASSGAQYSPSQDTPDAYHDDTAPDDSSPKDDTTPQAPPQQAPVEKPDPDKQQLEGIY